MDQQAASIREDICRLFSIEPSYERHKSYECSSSECNVLYCGSVASTTAQHLIKVDHHTEKKVAVICVDT